MAKTYNLFTSHSWSYGDDYDRLVALLDTRPYFSCKNYSIPKDDPIHAPASDAALYQAIVQQMTPCHVIIMLAGKYATFSRWIKRDRDSNGRIHHR